MSYDDDGYGGRGGRGGRGGGYGRGGGGYGGPREMHKATCSECGQECEVPFKPTEGRPVYCRDCFSKHRKF
ncbi:MAG: CxxC-x17-CxxC domain-containing protein [Candidatus Micrarchaeia archaeon]